MPCTLEHEESLASRGIFPVAGIDEAGRGPLAGPVVAAAVILPQGFRVGGLDDSKKLTATVRNRLYDCLTKTAGVRWSVAIRDHGAIDRLNILRATHEAMREAFSRLQAIHALIDGLPVHPFPGPQTALVGGDGLSMSIAAASVIAKVTRDRIMEEMHALYPAWGFSSHKGYATELHLIKLREHGPSPIHRHSFEPVAQTAFSF